MKESATFTNIFTAMNLLVLSYIIISGAFKDDKHNWNLTQEEVSDINDKTSYLSFCYRSSLIFRFRIPRPIIARNCQPRLEAITVATIPTDAAKADSLRTGLTESLKERRRVSSHSSASTPSLQQVGMAQESVSSSKLEFEREFQEKKSRILKKPSPSPSLRLCSSFSRCTLAFP